MRRVPKWIIKSAAMAVLLSAFVVQPTFAAARTSKNGSYFESLVRKIIRVLDTSQIGFPPG